MSVRAERSAAAVMSMQAGMVKKSWQVFDLGMAMATVSRWLRSQARGLRVGRASRRLSVTETVSLGEKRFVSILCVDGEQFLVGGSSSNLVLLAKLEKAAAVSGNGRNVSKSFGELMSAEIEGLPRTARVAADREGGL